MQLTALSENPSLIPAPTWSHNSLQPVPENSTPSSGQNKLLAYDIHKLIQTSIHTHK